MKSFWTTISLLVTGSFMQAQSERLPNGGGEFSTEKTVCITPAERLEVNAILEQNVARLKSEGLLPQIADRMAVAFDWPLRKISSLDYNSYYATNNYVDQNTAAGVLDNNCGNRTYDGHNGTDIDTWPFPWMLVTNNAVEVIAGEAGTIIGKFDGNPHDHCACSGSWNAIYVQHVDGSVAWYGHMKSGSLTGKTVGQTVAKGEYLGVVASSGCSTGPHLHFEVYEALPYQASNLIDPYAGPCNALNTQSWWANQQPYREPTLNANLTHSAVPVHGCPTTNEIPNLSNSYIAGATGYFATYYHDQLVGHVTAMQIIKPDNSVWQSWTHTSPSTYTRSWWWWSWVLPANGPNGVWKWQVTYQGQTYIHNFTVTGALPVELEAFRGKSLPDKRVLLEWETRNTVDNDYFEVERSAGGVSFSPIGRVPGNEDTNLKAKFDFIDENPWDGANFYRLRQVDKNGDATFSPVISVKLQGDDYAIYPNPTGEVFHLTGNKTEQIDLLAIYDMSGRLVLERATPGDIIEVADLDNGVYRVEIQCAGRISHLRLIKSGRK